MVAKWALVFGFVFIGLSLSFGYTFETIPIQAKENSEPLYDRVNIQIKPVSYSLKQENIPTYEITNPVKELPKNNKKFFENSVIIKDKNFVDDINYLYEMGYLPFKIVSYKNSKATLRWISKDVPPKLVALSPTSPYSILYKSAIYRFIRDYKVKFNTLNTKVAKSILSMAYNSHFKAKKPFVWVYVNQHIPQKVYVWENGKYIFESPVNTGVMGTTNSGTFMVYVRYKSAPMKGYFPGTNKYYNDPAVPWINYFYRGEALHGFPRKRYGYPQSAGCVELPIPKAKILYGILYKYAVVTLSHYDKQYLAAHPYKPPIMASRPAFKPVNPVRLSLEGW